MNETNVRNEILDSIDRVDHITMESSLDVLFSLGTAYEKAAMIMEYASTPDELSMFSIFQEADTPTQDNATAEAKPAENNAEAKPVENTSTTVSSDDKAPAANAEAKKKSGILWFIPNLIKKLFQFLKDAWNGVITPKAEQVSEKTQDLFEKIAGKDESWVKEHASELGLAGGALTAVLSFIAIVKHNEIAEMMASFGRSIGTVFKGMKAAPSIAWKGGSFITNVKFEGLIKTVAAYKNAVMAYKNNPDVKKLISDIDSIPTTPDTIIAESPFELSYDDIIKNFDEAKKTFGGDEEVNVDIKPIENPTDEQLKDMQNANGKTSLWAKVTGAISGVFKKLLSWVTGLFKKEKETDEQINAADNAAAPTEGEAGDGQTTENAGENAEEGAPAEETAPAAEGTGEAESSGAIKPGSKVTAEQLLEAFRDAYGDKTPSTWSVSNNTIANSQTGSTIEKIKLGTKLPGTRAVFDSNEGVYVIEYADETDTESVDIFTESAVDDELTDADIEVNNHWYN